MDLRLKLDDIIEGIEFQSDCSTIYLNKKTGKIITISDWKSSEQLRLSIIKFKRHFFKFKSFLREVLYENF